MRELSLKDNSGASLHLELGDLDTTERRQQYAEIVRIFLQVPEVEQVASKNPPRKRMKQATPPEDGQSGTDTAESGDKGLRNDSSGSLIDQVFKAISENAWLSANEIAKLCPNKPTRNTVGRITARLVEDGKVIRVWKSNKHLFALPGTPEIEDTTDQSLMSKVEDAIKTLTEAKTGREIAELMGMSKRYEIEQVQTSCATLRKDGRIKGKQVDRIWHYSPFEKLDIDEPQVPSVQTESEKVKIEDSRLVGRPQTIPREKILGVFSGAAWLPMEYIAMRLEREGITGFKGNTLSVALQEMSKSNFLEKRGKGKKVEYRIAQPQEDEAETQTLSPNAQLVRGVIATHGGLSTVKRIKGEIPLQPIEVTQALKELKLAGIVQLEDMLTLKYSLTKKAA